MDHFFFNLLYSVFSSGLVNLLASYFFLFAHTVCPSSFNFLIHSIIMFLSFSLHLAFNLEHLPIISCFHETFSSVWTVLATGQKGCWFCFVLDLTVLYIPQLIKTYRKCTVPEIGFWLSVKCDFFCSSTSPKLPMRKKKCTFQYVCAIRLKDLTQCWPHFELVCVIL